MHGLNEIKSINAWAAEQARKRETKRQKAQRVKESFKRAATPLALQVGPL